MQPPAAGTVWKHDGKLVVVVAPHHVVTKDAGDANWSPAVALKRCGPGGRAMRGETLRVLSLRDFYAQYKAA